MSDNIYDVTVIGGGPAGLFSAFYAGLREMKTKIIDGQDQLGGKVHLYPQKMIWDIGGTEPLAAGDLIKKSISQGLTFDPDVVLNTTITNIRKEDSNYFTIETSEGDKHFSKAVIITIGGGGMISPVKLDVEGAERFEGKTLHYAVPDIMSFKDKKILITGGSYSAVDWANDLTPIAREIHIIYRGDDLTAHEAEVSRLKKNGVKIRTQSVVTGVIGEDNLEFVEIKNKETGEVTNEAYDAIIVNHGYNQNNLLFRENHLGLNLENDFYIQASPTGITNVPGIYAAGDCIRYEGKVNLIAGAYSDAVNAVNNAKMYLDPKANKYAMVSSHNERFDEKNMEIMYKEEDA